MRVANGNGRRDENPVDRSAACHSPARWNSRYSRWRVGGLPLPRVPNRRDERQHQRAREKYERNRQPEPATRDVLRVAPWRLNPRARSDPPVRVRSAGASPTERPRETALGMGHEDHGARCRIAPRLYGLELGLQLPRSRRPPHPRLSTAPAARAR